MSEAAIRTLAASKRFAPATVERWLGCAAADRDEVLGLTESLRLGENHVRDMLDALEAIAHRRGCTFRDIIATAPIADILNAGRGRNETVHQLKHALRRLRYPQLSEAEDRLKELAKQMRLPIGAAIAVPDDLEGEEISITIRGATADELRRRLVNTADAVSRSELDEMFRVLGGER